MGTTNHVSDFIEIQFLHRDGIFTYDAFEFFEPSLLLAEKLVVFAIVQMLRPFQKCPLCLMDSRRACGRGFTQNNDLAGFQVAGSFCRRRASLSKARYWRGQGVAASSFMSRSWREFNSVAMVCLIVGGWWKAVRRKDERRDDPGARGSPCCPRRYGAPRHRPRAAHEPAVQAGLRPGAGKRPRALFAADHEPAGENAAMQAGCSCARRLRQILRSQVARASILAPA